MRFEFATATRIVFGPGTLKELGPIAAKTGCRALVVVGKSLERAKPLIHMLEANGVECERFSVSGEPTIETVELGTDCARGTHSDMVIGFGGGSALDTGKAIAALLTNEGNPLDFLEVVGRGSPLTQPSAPFFAIPTTAGTGTEVTRNAVLGSPEHRVKVSLRSPHMLPRLALVDPELTYSLPPGITATTGLDALTQVLEPYVSCRANPMTDTICREGMLRASRSLRGACANGKDADARIDMSIASLFGGLALANAGLGAVHGFAGPFGGMFPAPHGAVCAGLLPHVMVVNLDAMRQREPESPILQRYDEVGKILVGDQAASAQDGVAWVREVCTDLKVPFLSTYGFCERDIPDLIDKASAASSMKGNPVELTKTEMEEILRRAM